MCTVRTARGGCWLRRGSTPIDSVVRDTKIHLSTRYDTAALLLIYFSPYYCVHNKHFRAKYLPVVHTMCVCMAVLTVTIYSSTTEYTTNNSH